MEYKGITAYAVEKSCGLSNGYLGKQLKGGGSVGSEVLERIHQVYPELSLIWLISGEGQMLFDVDDKNELHDQQESYDQLIGKIQLLEDKIRLLESSLSDKERIISLMQGKKR